MNNRIKKGIVVGILSMLILLTTPTIVIGEIEASDDPIEFTFTGPTEAKDGEKCIYTFYLSPNPESDEYIVKVHWKEADMIIYEYPRDGVFHTGDYNEIWYVWYKSWWESGVFYPEATAYCGNSTYNATIEVTVPKNNPFSYKLNWLFEHFPIFTKLIRFLL